jgi:hypothetical protein
LASWCSASSRRSRATSTPLSRPPGTRLRIIDVIEDIRALDERIGLLNDRLDDMGARFDRLDAGIAELPTDTANDTQIETLLAEIQALQRLLDGLSLDLGIVCDVIGC